MLGWIGLGAASEKEEDAVEKLQAASFPATEEANTTKQQNPQPELVSGKSASHPIGSDARQVIDTLRRDLGNQRKMLDAFYSKVEPMIAQLKTVTESLDKLQSEVSPTHLKAHFVSSTRYAEGIANLKLELNACKVALSTPRPNPAPAHDVIAKEGAGSIQSALHEANAEISRCRNELHASVNELREEISRGFVRKDEFVEALEEFKNRSQKDVSSLNEALDLSSRRVGNIRRTDLQPLPEQRNLESAMDKLVSPMQELPVVSPPQRRSPPRTCKEKHVVLMRREGSKLGLTLDGSDGKYLVIERIAADGDIPSWNAANPSEALKVGDRIVAINDVHGDSGMLIDEMSSSSHTKTVLKVIRPTGFAKVIHLDEVKPQSKNRQFVVRLPANRAEKLGISLRCDEDEILRVATINPGCVQRWNENNASMAVRVDDRLMSANGVTGDPAAMLEAIRTEKEIDLIFMRAD